MTGQICIDEGISDDLSCARVRANGAKEIAGETV
jgi:hypothetical protein